MVFKFAKQYLDGKNLSQKEREKVFSEMVKRQDNIDRHERDYFHRMERPSTEEELEKYYQDYVDANKSWEDVKNECI
jgi:hypothetical protein